MTASSKFDPRVYYFIFTGADSTTQIKTIKQYPVTNGWSFFYTKDLKVKFIINSDQTDQTDCTDENE